jgi:hypothetical protein
LPVGRLDALRKGLRDRRLNEIAPAHRALALTLIGFSGVAVVLTSLLIFGRGPVNPAKPGFWYDVSGMVIFIGLLLPLTTFAGAFRAPAARGATGRMWAGLEWLLPYGGLVVLVASVTLIDLSALASKVGMVASLGLWFCLAVTSVYVLHRFGRATPDLLDPKRTAAVGVPTLLTLTLVLVVLIAEGSESVVTVMLKPALVLAALTSVVFLPAVAVGGAAKGLDAIRNRGERGVRFLRVRPWQVVTLGVVKIGVIVILWALSRSRSPTHSPLGSSLGAWLLAGGTALAVTVLFGVNHRVRLNKSDHLTVSRTAGILVGGSLAPLVALCIVVAISLVLVRQPVMLIGVAAVIGIALLAGRARAHRARLVAYASAAIVAMGAAVLIPRPVRVGGTPSPEFGLTILVGGAVIGVGLLAGVAAIVVIAIRRRRYAWLIYLGAVLSWILVIAGLKPLWAADMELLNFDLALSILLTGAAVLLAVKLQTTIDAFEITVTFAVMFLVIEVPLIGALMPAPDQAKRWLAVFALAGAAIGTVWSLTAALARASERSSAVVRLATSTLLYYLFLALAWLLPPASTDAIKSIPGAVQPFLTIPLVLLLVAAGEAAMKSDDEGVPPVTHPSFPEPR